MLSTLTEKHLPTIRLHQIGFIFQSFNLLSALTVLDNIALVAELAGAKRGEARKKAASILTDLRLSERLHFHPEQLSGGEKQRGAIARALVNDPTLILADEPTANLDSKIGHEIMRLLQGIAKQQRRSVIIVSHDQRIQDIADRVLWLEDGQFKEMATMATDPVCGMKIECEKAVTTEWEGQVFSFCSKGCRSEFLEEPQQFLNAVPQEKSEFHAAMPEQWEDTMDIQIVLSLLAEMRQFRQRDHWTRQQLEAHQAEALRSLREYTYAHSPFYGRFHQGLVDAPLHELPVLTKAIMMEHFDELVTDRTIRLEKVKAHLSHLSRDERFLGRYWVNATSGSS